MLGADAVNAKALIFNVKGEDLLFLDLPNNRLTDEARGEYAKLGLPAGPFLSALGLKLPAGEADLRTYGSRVPRSAPEG